MVLYSLRTTLCCNRTNDFAHSPVCVCVFVCARLWTNTEQLVFDFGGYKTNGKINDRMNMRKRWKKGRVPDTQQVSSTDTKHSSKWNDLNFKWKQNFQRPTDLLCVRWIGCALPSFFYFTLPLLDVQCYSIKLVWSVNVHVCCCCSLHMFCVCV